MVEDVTRLFWSNNNVLNILVMYIDCFKVPLTCGGIILLSITWFLSSHLRRIIIFFGLQQEVIQIFELLNLTVINMFKVINFFFCAIHLAWIQKLKQPMITLKGTTKIGHVLVLRDDYKQKMQTCREQSTQFISNITWQRNIFWVHYL